MYKYVVENNLNRSLVGPFDSEAEAFDWIDAAAKQSKEGVRLVVTRTVKKLYDKGMMPAFVK